MTTTTVLSSGRAPIQQTLWVEKYRPTQLQDIESHQEIIHMLRQFMQQNQLPHLFFYGPAGIGKTSTVLSLAKEMYRGKFRQMTLHLNASDQQGSDYFRKEIIDFISTKGLFVTMPYKIVILDEADSMSKESQIVLTEIINEYGEDVRFCLIGNYQHALLPELSSHLIKLLFLPIPKESSLTVGELILQKEQVPYERPALEHLYDVMGGDLRKFINMLQTVYLRHRSITLTGMITFIRQYEFGNIDFLFHLLGQTPFSIIHTVRAVKQYLMEHSQCFPWWMNKVSLYMCNRLTGPSLFTFIEQASQIEYTCSELVNYDIQMYAFLSLCHQYTNQLL